MVLNNGGEEEIVSGFRLESPSAWRDRSQGCTNNMNIDRHRKDERSMWRTQIEIEKRYVLEYVDRPTRDKKK
jgi:hypothetical protein